MHAKIATLSAGALAVVAFMGLPDRSAAQGKPATCSAVQGVLLAEGKAGWTPLVADAAAPVDRLLVALFGAEFTCGSGAVQALVVADVGQRGPFPVLEAAVRFHVAEKADLELTLDRGILILTNTRDKGAAHVRLRAGAESFDIELAEPKAKLGVEVYGRHVPGMAKLTSVKDDMPVLNVAFVALVGDVVVSTAKTATRLHAPPGPALYLWDNLTRTPDVHRFETLPDSLKPLTPEEKKKGEKLAGIAKAWSAQPAAAIAKAVHSADPIERKAAVVALGAIDDLSGLINALADKDHAEVREIAIVALRHWLGRAPGQSIRMYEHLTKKEGLTPTQGKNLLYLLHGIEESKRKQPETYDALIHALNHSKLPARALAHWHLVRLAPAGKSIAYDPTAAEPARVQAIAEWRKLIPEGELPPPPKEK